MTLTEEFNPARSVVHRLCAWVAAAMLLCSSLLVSGCGGSDDPPSGPVNVGIPQQPVAQSVVVGGSVTFSVTATGAGLTYQWQRSTDGSVTWVAIAGATSATYAIAAVDASMNGYAFRVLVTGAVDAVSSAAAVLSVTPAPTPVAITVQPANVTAIEAGSASFSVTATGTSPSYQWQSSPSGSTTWTAIGGATAATLTLTPLALTDSTRQYRVVVSNSVNSVTSNAAVLTVTALPTRPVITQDPTAVSVTPPTTATFAAAATGSPAPTLQWQLSTDGVNWTDIAGATGTSYTTPATTLADNGKRFRLHASNVQGDAFSNPALLTVALASGPVITVQPIDQSVTLPATATFAVTATGTPTPTYQWQQSSDAGVTYAAINGANSASYTTPATSSTDSGKRFRVIVANSAGSVTSNGARLTVNVGGTPQGNGAAAICAVYNQPVGTTVRTVYVNSSNPALNTVGTTVNNGTVVFAGHSATELVVQTSLSAVDLTAKIYGIFDATSGVTTVYGSVNRFSSSSSGVVQDTTAIYNPPIVDVTYSLSPGQTVASQTTNETDTTTTTVNGVTSAPTTTTVTQSTASTTFVGVEALTVPAGSFSRTCRFLGSNGVTQWTLPLYGTVLKDSQGGAATSVTVNGVPLPGN